uniref:Evasin n=1 Tax=Amblyomma tuberculatum TaxID=48802 RepID=A0A6M2E2U0_9ACAR
MTRQTAMMEAYFLMVFALAASHDASLQTDVTDASLQSNETDDYYPTDGCTCPITNLNNHNSSATKPPGCVYSCGTVNCTLTDEEPCYNISLLEFGSMEVNKTQSCLLGTCNNGTCVPDGGKELCYLGED